MATLDTTTTTTAAAGSLPEPPLMLGRRDYLRLFRGLQSKDQLQALDQLPGGSGLVSIGVPGAPVMLVRHAAHARHVLVTNQDTYIKGIDYKVLAVLLGNGLLTNLDQDVWQRQRKLVQPLFAKRHLSPMGTHMTDATGDWLDRLERTHPGGQELELGAAMMELTLDVVGRALFGASINEREVETVGDAMTDVLQAAQANFRVIALFRIASKIRGVEFDKLLKVRWRWRAKADRAAAALDVVVDRLIDDATAHGAAGDDLLSLLLSARDEDTGAPMARELVRDEVMTFLAAGHETTANAMTWMWLALSRNPDARKRMQAEVDEVLQGRRPTFDDLDQLPWTMACLQEAMRIYPPVPIVSRVARKADEIDGVPVPKGAAMIVLPYLIHRDPGMWPNPEGFDPERFMPGNGAGRHRQAFMPFGAGRRICVGSGFALMEGVLLAAMTAQRFEFDLKPGTTVLREFAITLRPREGLPVAAIRRAGAPEVVRGHEAGTPESIAKAQATVTAPAAEACPVDHGGQAAGDAATCPVDHGTPQA